MNPVLLIKTLHQLGIRTVAHAAAYRLALRVGAYSRMRCPAKNAHRLTRPLPVPSREEILALLSEDEKDSLRAEADSIVEGKYRPFSGDESPLEFRADSPLLHWSVYERSPAKRPPSPFGDIKYLWEPARFSWVFPLGRAYLLFGGSSGYAQAFWEYFEAFDAAAPPCMGIYWMNGQEVALRLLAFVWADAVFADSAESTPARRMRLAESVAEHAARIPPTLSYARAQNNNHLLSEAAALLTASLALPKHPDSARWYRIGRKWINWGFENQIAEDGEYIQHSVVYHRLMLHLALWVFAMEKARGESLLSAKARKRLAAAARWLVAWTDSQSGDAPNLGGNDGANLFPLATGGYRDFRPTAQAASRAFLHADAFPRGAWDELSLWFAAPPATHETPRETAYPILSQGATRVFLRVANGNLRLGHADMLHVDIWRNGTALTLDAGTYLYNGAPPWQNPWRAAKYHNTVTVDSLDPMTRAGKFLYLDWAKTQIIERGATCLVAEQDGYRKIGVLHRRAVTLKGERRVLVEDYLLARAPHRYRIHWLFPDGAWDISQEGENLSLNIEIPRVGRLRVLLRGASGRASLVHSGIKVWGEGESDSAEGWFSPTYGVKLPALSLSLESFTEEGVQFITEFQLPT